MTIICIVNSYERAMARNDVISQHKASVMK